MMLKKFTIFILCILVTSSVSAQCGRIPVRAKNGMVVSSQYLGSEVGRDVLRDGGNAIDAAIATAFALAVTLPSAGNIGGGGFIVYHGNDGTVTTFNFREKAPLAATPDMFLDENGKIFDNSNHRGPLSVGVPGTVAGLWLAHQRLGSKPWADLIQPAIDLAEKGFPANTRGFQRSLQTKENPMYDAAKKAFLKNGKDLFEMGEVWKQPDLAATLKRIQEEGRDGFYKGKTAKLFADYMKKHGGLITKEDLARYEPAEFKPVQTTYNGYDVYSMAPPSSGGIALTEMLNILEGYDLKEMGHNSAQYLHVLTETMRRAFADRAEFIGDPAFNPEMPVSELTSKSYAEELRNTINLSEVSVSDSAIFNQAHLTFESEETTHFSVVDAEGNAVSLTYTLENGYGSSLVVEGAGFLLNNEMGDFNPIPGYTSRSGLIGTPPNQVASEKHMLSSMTPTILAKNGKPVVLIGSPGGRTIINTVLQVILNVVDHEMNIGQAIEAGRIHHQWLPDVTSFERFAFSPDTRSIYEEMGHTIRFRNSQGSAMGIYIDHENGMIYGAADSRAYDGKAVGY